MHNKPSAEQYTRFPEAGSQQTHKRQRIRKETTRYTRTAAAGVALWAMYKKFRVFTLIKNIDETINQKTMNPIVMKRSFNKKAFISTALFTSGLCLPLSGFMIHIIQMEELTVAGHFWMSLHDVSGILFLIFSIMHIAINWRSLISYVRRAKDVLISKESFIAITLVIIIVGIVSSHPFHINN